MMFLFKGLNIFIF